MKECDHDWKAVSLFMVMGEMTIRRQCKKCLLCQDADIPNEGWYASPVYTLSAVTPKE